MKVTIDGAVIAEAAYDDLVKIEGDWYFRRRRSRREC